MTNLYDGALASDYVRRNRKVWGALGFRAFTSSVHEADKEVAAAFMETLRQERMLKLIQEGDAEQLEIIATRRINKYPSLEDMQELEDKVEALPSNTQKRRCGSMLVSAKNYIKKARAARNVLDVDPSDVKSEALVVTYSNLAHSAFKYVRALLNYDAPNEE